MKKQLFSLLLVSGISVSSFAQSYWAGSPATVQTTTTGNVGIGNTSPQAKLSIRSTLSQDGSGNIIGKPVVIENTSGSAEANLFEIFQRAPALPLAPPNPYSLIYWVSNNGNVGIKNSLRIGNTAATGSYANYKLSVDGDMIAKRCVIQTDSWADYVFADNYHLPTLNEVESFVTENNHLPGVPSEAEIREKGIDMGAMNKILMQKVEELTLYIIDLKKEVDQLKSQN